MTLFVSCCACFKKQEEIDADNTSGEEIGRGGGCFGKASTKVVPFIAPTPDTGILKKVSAYSAALTTGSGPMDGSLAGSAYDSDQTASHDQLETFTTSCRRNSRRVSFSPSLMRAFGPLDNSPPETAECVTVKTGIAIHFPPIRSDLSEVSLPGSTHSLDMEVLKAATRPDTSDGPETSADRPCCPTPSGQNYDVIPPETDSRIDLSDPEC